jgi:hypothetical protein
MNIPVDPIAVIKYLSQRLAELEIDRATLSAHSDNLRDVQNATADRLALLNEQLATMNEQNAMLSKRLEENGIAP